MLFEVGILEMEGRAEYSAGMVEDRLAVVDKGMSMLVVRLARVSQNLTFFNYVCYHTPEY